MRKRFLAGMLAVMLVMTTIFGQNTALAGEPGTAKSQEPSVALWVNGNWVSAQTLTGKSGDVTITFPLASGLFNNNADNYLRIQSNVANGGTDDTSVYLYGTNTTWTNSFSNGSWYVDDGSAWGAFSNENLNLWIEGFTGTAWERIHADDAYAKDTTRVLGKKSDSSYVGYARNIWVAADTVEKYSMFRVKGEFKVGTTLTVDQSDVLNLFPAANYSDCTFCEICGKCENESCTLGHAKCNGTSDHPSLALWVNGNWVSAQPLDGKSGDVTVTFPLASGLFNNNADNYLRIQSNVANGGTDDTSVYLYGTNTTWTNSFSNGSWYVDDGSAWAGFTNENLNLWIEGFNGTAWERIHADDTYAKDTTRVLGKKSDSSYVGYARNIWVAADTVEKYSMFRVKGEFKVGTNLTVDHSDVLNLFPAANYHDCTFCETCGKCENENCTLGHAKCDQKLGHPSLALYVNGNWVSAQSLEGKSGDVTVTFPLASGLFNNNADNYLRIQSNVANGGTDDTSVYLYGTNTNWTNSFSNGSWYVDDGSAWAGFTNENLNLWIEGFNGTEWVRIHDDTAYAKDTTRVLGKKSDSSYVGYARNIWVAANTVENYTMFRVKGEFKVGTDLTVDHSDVLNLFPAANYHNCTFCETCGKCENKDCTLGHEKCKCNVTDFNENAAVALYVNGNWVEAQSFKNQSGDVTVTFPVKTGLFNNNADNYLRIQSNVANGGTDATSIYLYGTNTTWTNSFSNGSWYVDDGSAWAGLTNENLNIWIEGFNGTAWERIHADDTYAKNTTREIGKKSDSGYVGYARNIWVNANTVEKYSAFRVKAMFKVGDELTADTGDIWNLFPTANFHTCVLCEVCGKCTIHEKDCPLSYGHCDASESGHHCDGQVCEDCGGCICEIEDCDCNHRKCDCSEIDPSVALYMNGNWIYAKKLTGLSGDVTMVFPILASNLTAGADNYARIATNVHRTDSADTSLSVYMTDTNWTNSFQSTWLWCDDKFAQTTNKNANIWIEGFNGTSWVSIQSDDPYKKDSVMILGKADDQTYSSVARNIWLSATALDGMKAFRVKVELKVGTGLRSYKDIEPLFPTANYKNCDLCEICGGCKDANCTVHTLCKATASGHHCVYCDTCGKCLCEEEDEDCDCTHDKCTCGETGHTCDFCEVCGKCICDDPDCTCVHDKCVGSENAAIRVRVNGSWYGYSLKDVERNQNVWLKIPVDISKFNASTENYINVSSNVINVAKAGDYSGNSLTATGIGTHALQIFMTNVQANCFRTSDVYCDNGWSGIDKTLNVKVQFYNGTEWVDGYAASSYATDVAEALGTSFDSTNNALATNIQIGSLQGYTAARILVQVNVGSVLRVSTGYQAETFATFLNPDLAKDNPGIVDPSEGHTKTPETPAETTGQKSGDDAVLYVRINGSWTSVSLKDYLGTTGWVYCPINLNLVNANHENYFNFRTNVKSKGEYSDTSVDIFLTEKEGDHAFKTNDTYCDNGWQEIVGQFPNVKLELYDGTEWVTMPAAENYYYDQHIGIVTDKNGVFTGVARNMNVGETEGYTQARIAILLHVGDKLTTTDDTNPEIDPNAGETPDPVTHNDEIIPENEGDKTTSMAFPTLKLRVNGIWFETELNPLKGINGEWVPFELPMNAIRGGQENYFTVNSNVGFNNGHSNNSVDVYFSYADKDFNSFICHDEYCDNGYQRYSDRNLNLKIEAFDGTDWILLAPVEEFYYDGSIAVGYDETACDFQSVARNVVIPETDGYQSIRVSVMVHVGNDLAQIEVKDDTPVVGPEPEDIDREEDITKPEHESLEETEAPTASIEEGTQKETVEGGEGGKGNEFPLPLAIGGGVLATAGIASALVAVLKKKKIKIKK